MHTHKLPNSKYCFACGLENETGLQLHFYADEAGRAVCDYTVADKFQSYPGMVNGGVVATMLDEMCIRAFLVEDARRLMYTAKLTTRYREHVPTEEPIHMVAEVLKDRGRSGVAEAKLYNQQGKLLAEAEALMVELKPGELEEHDLQGLGWKVYPDKVEQA